MIAGPQTELPHNVQMLVDRIVAVAPPIAANAVVSDPRAPDHFDLDALLRTGAYPSFVQLSEAGLDRLRRKIEIARKLYQHYEPDLSRPTTATPLSAAGVNQLCAVLLLASLCRRDVRFLNSALKLIDGLPSPFDVDISPELSSLAHATLDMLVPLQDPS